MNKFCEDCVKNFTIICTNAFSKIAQKCHFFVQLLHLLPLFRHLFDTFLQGDVTFAHFVTLYQKRIYFFILFICYIIDTFFEILYTIEYIKQINK